VHPGLSRVIIAATIGNVLEGFDFVVYGFFAVTIAEVFFPARNPTVSLLITLARSAWAMSFDHWARSSLAPTPTAPGARLG
jgi:hypothetical protein